MLEHCFLYQFADSWLNQSLSTYTHTGQEQMQYKSCTQMNILMCRVQGLTVGLTCQPRSMGKERTLNKNQICVESQFFLYIISKIISRKSKNCSGCVQQVFYLQLNHLWRKERNSSGYMTTFGTYYNYVKFKWPRLIVELWLDRFILIAVFGCPLCND